MSDNTTPTDELDETTFADSEDSQTTLLTFRTTTTVDDSGTPKEAIHVDVESEEEVDKNAEELEQYESLPEQNPMHEKVLTACEELDVDTRVIDLAPVPQVRTDDNGDAYIEDKRGLVRFYLGDENPEDRLLTTQDYVESARVAEEFTQRKNDLAEMYQVA